MGGTELNAVRTAERLDRNRVSLQVVSLQESGPLRGRYDAAGIPVTVFPLRNMYGPAAIRQGLRLASWFRRERPDVVHCQDIYSNIFVGFWARLAGMRNLIASRRWGSDSSKPRLDALNRFFSRRATRLLANSTQVGRSLVEREGYAADKLAILPNFLEPAAFDPVSADQRARWRTSLGIPPGSWVAGIVARLTPVKNHALLLRAVRRLTDARPELGIVIVGDGPERAPLEAMAAASGLGARVTFTGTLANRPNPHALFDISVLTSWSEGFPNSVVEAMAAGRAVVATDVGGVRDAVVDGGTGLLVPAGDDTRLADAIGQLHHEPALADRLGREGQRVAREQFSEEVVLNRLIALYEELAR